MIDSAPSGNELGNRVEPNRIGAVSIAVKVAKSIIETHFEIVRKIVSLRLEIHTYEMIAKLLKEDLSDIGATTDAVRRSIVAIICRSTIHPEMQQKIHHLTLRARPNYTRTEAQTNPLKERSQLFEWTPEINDHLLSLARTVTYKEEKKRRRTDWGAIANIMKQDHGVDLTTEQWQQRMQTLKRHREESA